MGASGRRGEEGVANKSDKLDPHWYITQAKEKLRRRRNHPERAGKAAGCRHQSDRLDRHRCRRHFADNQERRLIQPKGSPGWSSTQRRRAAICVYSHCPVSKLFSLPTNAEYFAHRWTPQFLLSFFTKMALMKTHLSTLSRKARV
jgi:hypothetical protein